MEKLFSNQLAKNKASTSAQSFLDVSEIDFYLRVAESSPKQSIHVGL